MEVSIEFINALVGYLGARPYQEVAPFIDYLKSEAQTQEVDTSPPPSEDENP